MRALVLIDGLHTAEMLDSLARLMNLREAELLLVYVQGPGQRAGLDLMRRRPGGHQLPPHRERELADAEREGAASALAEAEARARQVAPSVESVQLRGEPGRAVLDLAVQRRVDLIAVRAGGRDHVSAGPRSLGPIARFVADHSPCAVLLLRGG
jgi:nucleotide-binding universal stress UspA family protein